MTFVPCSSQGCKAEGTRWAYEYAVAQRPAKVVLIPRDLWIPRFVCDTHAREAAARGAPVNPPFEASLSP